MSHTRFCISLVTLGFLVCFAENPLRAQDEAATYKAKCSMCHGADGKGDTPAGTKMAVHDFASDEVQKQSDGDLAQIISKGKGKMPGYESKLKPEEIKELVSYVRKLGKSH